MSRTRCLHAEITDDGTAAGSGTTATENDRLVGEEELLAVGMLEGGLVGAGVARAVHHGGVIVNAEASEPSPH